MRQYTLSPSSNSAWRDSTPDISSDKSREHTGTPGQIEQFIVS